MTEKEFDVWEAAMALLDSLEAWDTAAALQELEDERGNHVAVGIQGRGMRIVLWPVYEEMPRSGRFLDTLQQADEFLGQEGN